MVISKARGYPQLQGVIKDLDGNVLVTYSINLASCSITKAEIRGNVEGLKIAWSLGVRKVALHMNSTALVNFFDKFRCQSTLTCNT
ncbi:hypothetical protein LINPERPRIM_LOCUS16761 [Linum perenne]